MFRKLIIHTAEHIRYIIGENKMNYTKMAMNTVATVEMIREHFPALDRIYNGHPVAYFDGPGGTQVPRTVVEEMNDYLYNHNANTHWAYPSSAETDEIIATSRGTIADFLNASPDEIVFGQNMTSLTFHLARALGREFNSGDEIVVSKLSADNANGNIDLNLNYEGRKTSTSPAVHVMRAQLKATF